MGTYLKNKTTLASIGNTISKLAKRWFIDAFSGMAQGLFVTLIVGTIIKQFGLVIQPKYPEAAKFFILLGNIASILMGVGIGCGIASYLKVPKLVMLGAMVSGFIGAYSQQFLTLDLKTITGALAKGLPGNPISAYVVTIISIELATLIHGKTKIDIIFVPIYMFFVSLISTYVAIPFIKLINYIAIGIEQSTKAQPFIMGIFISVVMGILLTMPTSSAAIWISIASGKNTDIMLLAGGAAVVGCASQMVGFAVMTIKENGVSGLIAQGLGTSMLQIPNILKHPAIFIPPIVSSAIVGPLATCVFKLKCTAIGGGMGTSGFVGIFGVVDAMKGDYINMIAGIILLMFVIPAVISYSLCSIMKNKGIIQSEHLKLNLN